MNKQLTAQEAVAQVGDGACLVTSGFQLITYAEELSAALEARFLETGSPKNLTYMHGAGQGRPGVLDLGVTHYGHEGLIGRYITGHFAGNKAMIDLCVQNKIECYNLPQGVISQLYRCAAAGKKGELTKVGLGTFLDPRVEGGKMNEATTYDLVKLVESEGEEYLFYEAPKVDVAFIRGTTADEFGNITMEEECAPIDALDIALAAKANGGKVFVQVKNIAAASSLDAKDVVIPGVLVDGVVVTTDAQKYHRQTPGAFYDPAMAGHHKVLSEGFRPIPLDERKVIARRAAMELQPASPVNLGIGVPECVANVAGEEGVADELILTIEDGVIGGVPVGGDHFGSAVNHWAALPMGSQFDLYNGGNLKMAFLGFAEIGRSGDVNASKFGKNLSGCGGFIDISQFTPKIIFCGTLTAGGLQVAVQDGGIKIIQEGKKKKFLEEVGQITFSSKFANEHGQQVLVITERCVFRLSAEGFVLEEVAPGIDIEKDIVANMAFRPIIPDAVKTMDERLFRDEPMGLRATILSRPE